jgi:aspartyl-tRNA(Asn)/glutamyl-tRNA(Gln) amidotransferase subunit A
MNYVATTIASAAKNLRDGSLSSAVLTESLLRRAKALDQGLGVFLHVNEKSAIRQAQVADEELQHGVDRGPLHGIPVALKDVIATWDAPTTAQSRLLANGSPTLWYDAECVVRLRSAGAVILGKTTTMEFAKGRPQMDDPFPLPRNPWQRDHWTGGSSSGSASGVAAGMFLCALGTDTGGSIRLPAAFCGVTGFKPTFGRVSLDGIIPLAHNMDHVGPIARTAQDCGLVQSVLSKDVSDRVADWMQPDKHARPVRELRIGIDSSILGDDRIDDDVRVRFREALDDLTAEGATLVDVKIPHFEDLVTASNVVSLVEAFTYHRRTLEAAGELYGANTWRTLMGGALYLGSDYAQALQVIAVARRRLERFMDSVDLVAMPTTSRPADRFGSLNDSSLIPRPYFTRPWNAVGFPAISLPMGLSRNNLPVGLQFIGRRGNDQQVLRAGHDYQQCTSHHLLQPELSTGEFSDA